MSASSPTPIWRVVGTKQVKYSARVINTNRILVERDNWKYALYNDLPPKSSGPINLCKVDRWYYLSDGHHRLARALQTGAEIIDAIVVRDVPYYDQLSELVRGALDDWVWVSITTTNNLTINILQGDENVI